MCFFNTYVLFMFLTIIYKLIISIFVMCHNFYMFTTAHISLMFCREQMFVHMRML